MKKIIFFVAISLLFSTNIFAQYETYHVKKGESIESLAEKFDVSQKDLLDLNPNLKKGSIKGKIISIPHHEATDKTPKAQSVSFKDYTVGKKETLYSIAKENGISVDDIKYYNPSVEKEGLKADQTIRIPLFGKKQKDLNASIGVSNFENLAHIVKPKETKYGIARQYGMTVDQLDSLNPNMGGLYPGQVLKVTNPNAKHSNPNFTYYTVKPKETFYSLTHKFDISKDSLIKLNPILKDTGVQIGMELKIPNKNGISEYDKSEASSNKVNLTQHIVNNSPKKVVILLPFKLKEYQSSQDKEHRLKNNQITQISLDLYSGIKMALDSIHNMGIPVSAKVYDTELSTGTINRILESHNFDDTQIIIGPLLSKNINLVASKLQKEDIAILSPLTNDELSGSDKIFQTRPSKSAQEQAIIRYLNKHINDTVDRDNKKEDINLLVISDQKHRSFANKIRMIFPSSSQVDQAKKEYIQRSDLTKKLSKNRPNWFVVETDDYGVISNTMSYLNSMRHNYDIRVFTSHKNSIYDEEVPPEYLSHLDFTYATVDKCEVEDERDNFRKQYYNTYQITPNKYVVRGFDETYDALLRAASADNIFESVKDLSGYTEYVGNRFDYHKKMMGGYDNNAVFLIKYEKDLHLEILN